MTVDDFVATPLRLNTASQTDIPVNVSTAPGLNEEIEKGNYINNRSRSDYKHKSP
jgi:hypothetical protein